MILTDQSSLHQTQGLVTSYLSAHGLTDKSALQRTQHAHRHKWGSVLSHVEQALLCCTLAKLTSKLVPVQRSYAGLQGMSSCCWKSNSQCIKSPEAHQACVSADNKHTIQHGMSARNEQHSTYCQSCIFVLGYILQSAVQLQHITLRVLSVFRSRDILESGKKKCNRPKLSRSFRQTSLANAFIAPGYCTGSSSTTCTHIMPVLTRSFCSAAVLW